MRRAALGLLLAVAPVPRPGPGAARTTTHDLGPFDTTPRGRLPGCEKPKGLLDPPGNVFEWTTDPAPGGGGARCLVKGGGSWDEKGCGACRSVAGHARPAGLEHMRIGCRLVRAANQRLTPGARGELASDRKKGSDPDGSDP